MEKEPIKIDIREPEPIGEIGGENAWDALHPERQLTLTECEAARPACAGDELLRRRGFLR